MCLLKFGGREIAQAGVNPLVLVDVGQELTDLSQGIHKISILAQGNVLPAHMLRMWLTSFIVRISRSA